MKKILALLLLSATALTAPAQPQKQNSELKVISFNIRLGSDWSRPLDGPHFWDFRKEAVLRMIAAESPDAIGMQEVLPGQLHYLDSALSDYRRIGVGREDGKEQGECMAVYFKKERFELLKSATCWLSETPRQPSKGWDAACHRTVTIVLLRDRLTHKELLYMNTHLDHVGLTARAESVKLLARLAAEWVPQEVPLIIGGDMNTAEQDSIFDALTASGFAKARQSALATDNEQPYNAFGKGQPQQIDHFFCRGIRLKVFRTLKDDYGVPYISDHYPVEIIFDL